MARECRQNYVWYSHKHQMNSEWRGYSFQVWTRQEEVTLHFPGPHFQTSQKETHEGRYWPIKVKQTHTLLWFIITLDTRLPILKAAGKHTELSPEPYVPYVQASLHSPRGLWRQGCTGKHPGSLVPTSPLPPPSETTSKTIKSENLTSSPPAPRFQSPWQFEKNSSILSLNTFCSDVPVLKYCPSQGIYVLKEESKREEGFFRKCRCNLKLAIIIFTSCVRLITSQTMCFLYLEISESSPSPGLQFPFCRWNNC